MDYDLVLNTWIENHGRCGEPCRYAGKDGLMKYTEAIGARVWRINNG